jgi:hypothetical protein
MTLYAPSRMTPGPCPGMRRVRILHAAIVLQAYRM